MPPTQSQVAAIQKYVPEFQPQNVAPAAPAALPAAPAQPLAPVSPASTGATPNVPTGLDPTAYTLTKAIAYQENGGNTPSYTIASGDDGSTPDGSSGKLGGGAYQFTSPTWAAWAGQVLGNPNAPMTPENQNQVAYTKIKSWLDAGYTTAQAASMWNAGEGAPNAYQDTTQTHGDTPQYVNNVQKYAEQLWNGQTPTAPTQTPAPSIGGFAGNVVKSGANLLGNIGDALLHPIQTVENIGSTAVGGLQELGGQTNSNTAEFDALKNYFGSRYGSVNDLGNTLYSDPVGFLADLSTAFGGAAGAAGIGGKLADVADLGDLSKAAIPETEEAAGVAAQAGTGVAGGLQTASNALGKAAEYTNPLTPVIAGGAAVAGKLQPLALEATAQILGQDTPVIKDVIENPQNYSKEAMAAMTRSNLSQEVESAFREKTDAFDETGSGYQDVRDSNTNVKVSRNFLENQLRKNAGVAVKDGEIVAKGSSAVRSSKDVAALQNLYDIWKPEFRKGSLTPNEFLNFRQDLAAAAKYDKEFTASKPVEAVAAKIRTDFNTEYRSQIPGLEEKDADFSSQKADLDRLSKGFFDKDGNLTPAAINKIANSTNKGRDADIKRLEEIMPGITDRIRTLRNIEKIQESGIKVGTYTRSIAQAGRLGAILYGGVTGNLRVLGGALAMDAIADPENAVEILRAVGKIKPEAVHVALAYMAKYAVTGAVADKATTGQVGEPAPESGSQSPLPQSGDALGQTDDATGQTQ